MKSDSRLPVALHVLLHMSEMDGVATSEALGTMMDTSPVVFRRTMAGLREAGIVRSSKGHGGGWSLARRLDEVTLADVYEALEMTRLFVVGPRDDKPRCLLEQAVNRAIGDALAEAEALLVASLRTVTVADVLSDAVRRDEKGDMRRARRSRKERRKHA